MLRGYKVTFDDLKKSGWTGTKKDIDESLRFENVTYVKTPAEANVIPIPLSVRPDTLPEELLLKIIKHLNQPEWKFTAFDCSDFEGMYPKVPMWMPIRSNLKSWMKRENPRSISWAWPVEDLKHLVSIPEGGFKYPLGFQGWVWSNVRVHSTASCNATFGRGFDFSGYKDFYGYIEKTPEGFRRKEQFHRSLSECKLQLTPCSIHEVFPYRFFEAMSAGRVPVLFCTGYQLPWAHRIPWDEVSIRFEANDCVNAGPLIKTWLLNHTDEQIIEMGLKARHYWDRYLNRDKANAMFTEAITDLLRSENRL